MQNHMSKTTHALRSMTAPYAESCSVPAQTNVGLSRTNKAVSAMNASYSEESHQTQHGNHVLTVTNMTPIYNNEEKFTVKRNIEKALYQVFSKHNKRK